MWERGSLHSLPALLHRGPVTGCPEGRLSWPVLLTQQPACLSQHRPASAGSCSQLRLLLSSPSLLPPSVPPGLHPVTWRCWGPDGPRVGELARRAQAEHTVPPQWGEGRASLAKGTPELEQSCRLGFHWDTGACKKQALRLSPRLLSGGCICPKDPSSSHEHCLVGCSCAPCWVPGGPGRVCQNALVEARWQAGA